MRGAWQSGLLASPWQCCKGREDVSFFFLLFCPLPSDLTWFWPRVPCRGHSLFPLSSVSIPFTRCCSCLLDEILGSGKHQVNDSPFFSIELKSSIVEKDLNLMLDIHKHLSSFWQLVCSTIFLWRYPPTGDDICHQEGREGEKLLQFILLTTSVQMHLHSFLKFWILLPQGTSLSKITFAVREHPSGSKSCPVESSPL